MFWIEKFDSPTINGAPWAPVAQLIEQLPSKQWVDGSNPSGRAIFLLPLKPLNESGIVGPTLRVKT